MSDFASIVIIKRTGADGPRFPLRRNECLFGRNATCDLRVQLPGVALEHAKVSRSENRQFYLENISGSETMINGNLMKECVELSNMDVFSISGRSFRFEYEQPKRKSLGLKKLSLNNSGHLVSPLKEANRVVKDSPRNPIQRRASLRESLGKLRRSSVPFQEMEEPVSNTPEEAEEQPNPLPRRASLRESVGKLRRSSVAFQEEEKPVSNTPEKPEEQQVNPAMPTTKSYPTTPVSTKKSKKRVSFGPNLSPEQFDIALPVSTPVRKGATPRRLSAPLSKPCISPARRRYSIAAPSFVSKIEEEAEESDEMSDDEEINHPKAESPAVEIVEVLQTERPKLATPLRAEIKVGKKLRAANKKMATPLRNAIKQGFRLKATKKKLNTLLRQQIKVGKKLSRKRLNTPVRKAIQAKPKLRAIRTRMPTPVRKAIEAKPSLRQTKRALEEDLQAEIKKGKSLKQTKKAMPEPLQEEIKTGRKFLRIKRRLNSDLQDEIMAGKELNVTRKKMAAKLQGEIAKGVQLRPTRKRMPTMLQDEIKSGIELSKTKQSLKTPVRKEIESGVNLRKTKRRMGTMLQDEIKSGIELSKTKPSLKTPVRKEIESGVNLRKTKRRMGTMLQDEIKSGIELSKTKQSLKTPVRKEIEYGVNLRKTKRRMGTMLQDEIKSSIELSKTKQSLKTPIRKEIESGVNLRKTKRRMGTMLQDEIKSSIELSKTKQSLKTPIRKEIETGVKLRPTKPKDEEQPGEPSKTPKRRLSSVDDAPQSTRKKFKTSSRTPQKAGFFPSTRSRTRSISRRKSTKKPSYAEIVKRSKLVAKRRLSTKQKDVFKFEAEQQVVSSSKATGSKAAGTIMKVSKKNKTPSRRKSLAQSKVFDGKTAGDWNVVVNKRKIKKIKRQRAVKPQQELDVEGVSSLFKTPKATHSQALVETEKEETPIGRPIRKCRMSSSPGDAVLYGLAKLMKTPKVKQNNEPDLEGVAELFEVLEMASPIAVSGTPSLRRASDRVSIVTPLPINKTPSLRVKESANDVVFPLQLSSTPSLRKATDNLTVALPEEPLRTPSLRRVSESLTAVAFPEEPRQTPSLRQGGKNPTVVAAETPKHTPSLKKAEENVLVSSQLQASITPSLKNIQKVVVAISPVYSTSPTEIAKSSSTRKQSRTVAVVSPFPVQSNPPPQLTSPSVQSTPSEMQPTPATVEPLPQQTLPSDDLTSKPADEEPPTSKTTVAKRSTRSKRKVEPDTLPAAKRSRRATSRNNTAKVVVETVESQTELSIGRASTHSSRSAVTSHSQMQKRTRSRPAKQPPVSVLQQSIIEVVDSEEEAEDKVDSKSKRTTRARRPVPAEPMPTSVQPAPPQVQPTVKPSSTVQSSEDLISEPPTSTDKESKSKTTKSTRSKCIVEPDIQEAKSTRRTTSRNNRAKVINEKETEKPRASTRSGKMDDKNSVTSESKLPKKTRARSTKLPEKSQKENVVDLEEQVENDVDSKSKRSTRVSRRKPTNEKAKVQSTPKIPTRSGKSKNVAGIPETPQPLQFTKSRLEPIIEVPTPASSLRVNSIKKSLLESQRSTRRDITTVIEEVVEPVMPMASDECYVAKQETKAKGRVSRTKRTAAAAEKSVEKGKEAESETVPNGKRATRAKRGIAAVVVEENLPAPKRQKKEVVDAGGKKVDDGKTVEREKRGGRLEEKVVEELTISNTRSTRRKRPAVKEIEIVEETVVTYTRTTRQRSKPVVESASVETHVEERGRRARKGNSGSQTIEKDSGKRRKMTRQKQGAVQENANVEIAVEKEEVKSGRTRSKRTGKTRDNVTEQVTRVTRSRRGAK